MHVSESNMARLKYVIVIAGILIVTTLAISWIQMPNVTTRRQGIPAQQCNGQQDRERITSTRESIDRMLASEYSIPPSSWTDGADCLPNRNIVYIKVHKAASSTMNQILLRYGLMRNKIIAIPKWWHYFDFNKHFHRSMALGYEKYRGKSELLISHARLNRVEMDAVVEDAVYLASLRLPAAQLESTFGFFNLGRYMKTDGKRAPLDVFMSDPDYYTNNVNFKDGSLRNEQIFDLGLDPQYFDDMCAVERKIRSLDEEFDLVLISEYLDESLVLMKYLLCLDFKDILYINANVRSKKYRVPLSKETSVKIEQWNAADMLLYKHFNQTLWNRIENYGEQFYKDLQTFKNLKDNVTKECICLTDRDVDQRLWKIRLKSDASQFCRNLTRNTNPTIKSMRNEIINKYGNIFDRTFNRVVVWGDNFYKNHWKSG